MKAAEKPRLVAPAPRPRVVIGSRWKPEHAISRTDSGYWERAIPAELMSRDELRVQKALLRPGPEAAKLIQGLRGENWPGHYKEMQ